MLLLSNLLYFNYYEKEAIVSSSTNQPNAENLNFNNEDFEASKTKANDVKRSNIISTKKINQENLKIDQTKISKSKNKKTLEISSKKEDLNTLSKSTKLE